VHGAQILALATNAGVPSARWRRSRPSSAPSKMPRSRPRGVFLATTALVYYVVIAGWLNAVLPVPSSRPNLPRQSSRR
jgi:hypothetical protein